MKKGKYCKHDQIKGDKEKISYGGREVFGLHVGRTLTALYKIYEDENTVKIMEIVPMDEAHKKYKD